MAIEESPLTRAELREELDRTLRHQGRPGRPRNPHHRRHGFTDTLAGRASFGSGSRGRRCRHRRGSAGCLTAPGGPTRTARDGSS